MVFSMRVSRCCYLLTLRQGTILIAIVDLSLMSFLLFLLVLGGSHQQEIASLLNEDLHDLESVDELSFDSEVLGFPVLANNERKMLSGQRIATLMMLFTYAGIALVLIHFISCVMLLYGVTRNLPYFLYPWSFIVLASLVMHVTGLLVFTFAPYRACKVEIVTTAAIIIGIELYAWVIVHSYFKEVTACRQLEGVIVTKTVVTKKTPSVTSKKLPISI